MPERIGRRSDRMKSTTDTDRIPSPKRRTTLQTSPYITLQLFRHHHHTHRLWCGCSIGRATAISREASSCTSPPPGSWGLVPLLIRMVDPVPGSVDVSCPSPLRPRPRGYHNIVSVHLLCPPRRQHERESLMACFTTRKTHHCIPVPSHGTMLCPCCRGRSSGKQIP